MCEPRNINNNFFNQQILSKFKINNFKIVNDNYIFQIPTGYPVLNFIENFPLFKNISFTKSSTKRYINKKYVVKCNTAYKYSNWLRKNSVLCSTNRLDDEYQLTNWGIEKLKYNKIKKKKDIKVYSWKIRCSGNNLCQRECGEIGKCSEKCNFSNKDYVKQHYKEFQKHKCNEVISFDVYLSNIDITEISFSVNFHKPIEYSIKDLK
ncbi:hypothetical protein BCR36DRAFT_289697 [Piromyces finnis]|uniref:Uncharacterized protein n=1 Tax=Piromyces finnis TaxID=1754191 RepID=A0A1Y1VAQ8_9FUNG|nr:hypothetical protein BCR36DRAFT_289697 [Piromyces finnis]|eukprot:ORX50648.1 hypothetical protein BCR36DRAFT_289697 [Piromyces finnis]